MQTKEYTRTCFCYNITGLEIKYYNYFNCLLLKTKLEIREDFRNATLNVAERH